MMADFHTILQPAKDEVGQNPVPRPAKFVYASEVEHAAPVDGEAPGVPPPAGLHDANGQEYEPWGHRK